MAVTVTAVPTVQNEAKESFDLSFTSTTSSASITTSKLKRISRYEVCRFGTAGGANTGRLILTLAAPGTSIADADRPEKDLGTFTVTREVIDPAGTLGTELFRLTAYED